jgi:hypothetical protein
METPKIDEIFDQDYLKIRESIKGLTEILKIILSEDDIYYIMSIDNLNALHEHLLTIMKHAYTPRAVRMKLREVEYDEQEAQETFLK